MKRTIKHTLVLVVLSLCMTGCNGFSLPGIFGFGGDEGPLVLTIEADNKDELAVVTALETARLNYIFRLHVLRRKMKNIGDMQKQCWTERELENLINTQTVRFEGIGKIVPMPGATNTLIKANEVMLVELVAAARQDYLQAVDDAISFYKAKKDAIKLALLNEMSYRFDPIQTYAYYLSAEIPPADLRASKRISGADTMFTRAKKIYKDSMSILNAFNRTSARKKQLQALGMFQELIRKYPQSLQVGRCAYYIAELYRANNESTRAAVWYDRAWQWDSVLPEYARFRAATLYDFKIRDPDKAVDYYRLAIKYEWDNRANRDYAEQRVKDILRRH